MESLFAKLIKGVLSLLGIICIPAMMRSQSVEPFSPYGIFSPSVESYQMTRCGNLLPSLYTGAMTFSLPLMTYSDPDFTIPVTLEYRFDGYKPCWTSGPAPTSLSLPDGQPSTRWQRSTEACRRTTSAETTL